MVRHCGGCAYFINRVSLGWDNTHCELQQSIHGGYKVIYADNIACPEYIWKNDIEAIEANKILLASK